jgi:hypothetical protein
MGNGDIYTDPFYRDVEISSTYIRELLLDVVN